MVAISLFLLGSMFASVLLVVYGIYRLVGRVGGGQESWDESPRRGGHEDGEDR